jgi:hypothetical protein
MNVRRATILGAAPACDACSAANGLLEPAGEDGP